MVVQHNLTAMNSNRMLGLTTSAQAKSTEKLSSGYKINRAADDAAGLSISEKMRKQIRGLTQASLNAADGISAVQTAEGALNEVQDMLQRMNELAVKAANGTMSEDDRGYIQDEIDQLITEIDRVSETTKFNESYLLKGSKDEGIKADVNGVVNGEVQDGTYVEGKGNIYQNQIASAATDLANGTKDVAVIEFIDNDGNTQKVKLDFAVGKDATATAQNLVDAINNDATLSKVFTATAGVNGRFQLESIADGSETSSDRNKVKGEITFESNDAGTQKTTLANTTGTVTTATAGSYQVKINSTDITPSTIAPTASAGFKNGDSITVDGKTYTFSSDAAGTGDNTFKDLAQLQDLLGDEYEVSVNITGTLTEKTYDKAGNVTSVVKSDYASTAETAYGANKSTVLNNSFQLTGPADVAAPNAGTAGIQKSYSDLQMNLNIVRKAGAEAAKNTLNFSLQVGADTSEENKISIDIQSMSARSLGINGIRVDGKDSLNADRAVNTIAKAIQTVSTQRSALGAVQNRLEHTINNLDNVVENTTAAESQIRDTDMATEMVKFSNNNILAQAGQAMLAQANQANQGVLSLLG